MCGIAGFTGRCDLEVLEAFQASQRHRGPDDHGMLCDSRVGLAVNRLAIIDIEGGHQPIFNEDRTCAIVFNGEIYNYRELRGELAGRHVFTTDSDTEVILHLYEEEGPEVSRRLRGDFALCIWDSRDGSCFLSRDPLGVKPLFYTMTSAGGLIFASELTALLRHPDAPVSLDMDAVTELLTCLYIAAPRSLVRGVRKLQAGESLLWQNGAVRTWQYWTIPDPDPTLRSRDGFRERGIDLLRTAVNRRLVADVPVGAFLSGGLDSSLIVALASEQQRGLGTFSVGFGERDFDELEYARRVSRLFGTDHHEFILRPDALESIEAVIAAMDEPIADSSAVPTFLVARETARHGKVVLSGVGGDEMFAGYPRYAGAKLSEKIPGALAGAVATATGVFSSQPSGRDVGGWIRRFGEGMRLEPRERYWHWTTYTNPHLRRQLLRAPVDLELPFEREAGAILESGAGSYLDRIFRLDVRRYLASGLLKFSDTMTMANSLEVRVPFCDVDLVEHVARTPADVRFPGYRLKSVLRGIARRYLPDDVVRRRKQGFMIPIGRWFREELRDYIRHELRETRLPDFMNSAGVSALVEEHVSGGRNHTHVLWGVLVLVRWLEMHSSLRFQPQTVDHA